MRRSKTKALQQVNENTFIRLIKAVVKHTVKARKRPAHFVKGSVHPNYKQTYFLTYFYRYLVMQKAYFMSRF